MWDLLFAEHLRSDIVDLTCVAMLLRTRWSLIEADYTTAITALNHYKLPDTDEGPRSLVRDAIFLDKNRDAAAGATLITRYSGRRPKQNDAQTSRSSSATRAVRNVQHQASSNASPGRFTSQQRQLEGLLRDVTGNLQKRTEGWDVSKVVRSAVGEVRRNMNNYQPPHSRHASLDTPHAVVPARTRVEAKAEEAREMQRKLRQLQERNAVLGKMLDEALQSLRAIKVANADGTGEAEQSLNICLARIQFVSVYLSDSDIPIPQEEGAQDAKSPAEILIPPEEPVLLVSAPPESEVEATSDEKQEEQPREPLASAPEMQRGREKQKTLQRPSLMDSSFSFMLGEGRHRSSFVSSVSNLPEQSRPGTASEPKGKPKKTAAEKKKRPERRDSESEDDGFTLTNIQGGQG